MLKHRFKYTRNIFIWQVQVESYLKLKDYWCFFELILNIKVLKENSSNFIGMVVIDAQYNQVTLFVLHVTFFVKLCHEYSTRFFPVFILYFHFLFCYSQERSNYYGNGAFSYCLWLYICIVAFCNICHFDRKNLTNKVWSKTSFTNNTY